MSKGLLPANFIHKRLLPTTWWYVKDLHSKHLYVDKQLLMLLVPLHQSHAIIVESYFNIQSSFQIRINKGTVGFSSVFLPIKIMIFQEDLIISTPFMNDLLPLISHVYKTHGAF